MTAQHSALSPCIASCDMSAKNGKPAFDRRTATISCNHCAIEFLLDFILLKYHLLPHCNSHTGSIWFPKHVSG